MSYPLPDVTLVPEKEGEFFPGRGATHMCITRDCAVFSMGDGRILVRGLRTSAPNAEDTDAEDTDVEDIQDAEGSYRYLDVNNVVNLCAGKKDNTIYILHDANVSYMNVASGEILATFPLDKRIFNNRNPSRFLSANNRYVFIGGDSEYEILSSNLDKSIHSQEKPGRLIHLLAGDSTKSLQLGGNDALLVDVLDKAVDVKSITTSADSFHEGAGYLMDVMEARDGKVLILTSTGMFAGQPGRIEPYLAWETLKTPHLMPMRMSYDKYRRRIFVLCFDGHVVTISLGTSLLQKVWIKGTVLTSIGRAEVSGGGGSASAGPDGKPARQKRNVHPFRRHYPHGRRSQSRSRSRSRRHNRSRG